MVVRQMGEGNEFPGCMRLRMRAHAKGCIHRLESKLRVGQMNCGVAGGFMFWLGKTLAEMMIGACVLLGAAALLMTFLWWIRRG